MGGGRLKPLQGKWLFWRHAEETNGDLNSSWRIGCWICRYTAWFLGPYCSSVRPPVGPECGPWLCASEGQSIFLRRSDLLPFTRSVLHLVRWFILVPLRVHLAPAQVVRLGHPQTVHLGLLSDGSSWRLARRSILVPSRSTMVFSQDGPWSALRVILIPILSPRLLPGRRSCPNHSHLTTLCAL